jgi:hypothetical protein
MTIVHCLRRNTSSTLVYTIAKIIRTPFYNITVWRVFATKIIYVYKSNSHGSQEVFPHPSRLHIWRHVDGSEHGEQNTFDASTSVDASAGDKSTQYMYM